MLLMAYLITRDESWADAKIRVISTPVLNWSKNSTEDLKGLLEEIRIKAEPEIVDKPDLKKIVETSTGSTIVFMPFRLKKDRIVNPYNIPVDELISGLPVVSLVLAAEDIDLDAEPEEGKAGEMALALDELSDAENKVRDAEKKAAKLLNEAEEKSDALKADPSSWTDEELLEKVKAAQVAKDEADKAVKNEAKALAKAEEAARKAELLGVNTIKEHKDVGETKGDI